MRILPYGVIALMLFGSTAIATAQQEKTQQNSADEALTRSAPEAKQAPQAPPQISPTQASQPGIQAQQPALVDGKLAVPGAQTNAQTEPSKTSAQNAAKDKEPLVTGQAPN